MSQLPKNPRPLLISPNHNIIQSRILTSLATAQNHLAPPGKHPILILANQTTRIPGIPNNTPRQITSIPHSGIRSSKVKRNHNMRRITQQRNPLRPRRLLRKRKLDKTHGGLHHILGLGQPDDIREIRREVPRLVNAALVELFAGSVAHPLPFLLGSVAADTAGPVVES